jgi:PmbA protein
MAAAISTAEIGDPVEFSFPENVQIITPESGYIPPTTDKLVNIGENLITQVHQYNPDILVDVGFSMRSGQVKLANTSNVYTERSAKIVSASIGGNLVRGEDFMQAYSYDVARDGEPDYDLMLAQLLEKYRRAEKTLPLPVVNFLSCLPLEQLPARLVDYSIQFFLVK